MTHLNQPLTAAPARPASVVVLGVAAMVVGAMGVLGCGCWQLLVSRDAASAGGHVLPNGSVLPIDPGFFAYNVAVASFDLLTSAVLFFVAYLGMRMSPSGRRWAVMVSAAIVVLAAAKLAGGLLVYRQAETDLRLADLASMTADQRKNVPADAEQIVRLRSVWGPVILFAVQALVPALLLVFWTGRTVKAAFDAR